MPNTPSEVVEGCSFGEKYVDLPLKEPKTSEGGFCSFIIEGQALCLRQTWKLLPQNIGAQLWIQEEAHSEGKGLTCLGFQQQCDVTVKGAVFRARQPEFKSHLYC